jgi:hypothetical protein
VTLLRLLTLVTATAACAGHPAPAPAQQPTSSVGGDQGSLVPPGHGQLRQDVITLSLRSGSLELRFTPLDERVTRLLSSDAYQSLQVLLTRQAGAIDSTVSRLGIRTPGLALVSFYGLAPNTRFDPQLVTLTVRNQQFQPAAVLPISTSFSSQQLDTRDQATGLIIFDQPIPVTEPFDLDYLDASSSDWARRLNRFDRERARIRAKAGSPDPNGNGGR